MLAGLGDVLALNSEGVQALKCFFFTRNSPYYQQNCTSSIPFTQDVQAATSPSLPMGYDPVTGTIAADNTTGQTQPSPPYGPAIARALPATSDSSGDQQPFPFGLILALAAGFGLLAYAGTGVRR